MSDFFSTHLDYVLFFCGIAYIMLAAMVFPLARDKEERLPWRYMGMFGLLYGISEFADIMALRLDERPVFAAIRLIILTAGFLCLMEFGRRGTAAAGGRVPGRWILLLPPAFATFGGLYGLAGMNLAVRYFIGLVGGLWAAWALLRERSPENPASGLLLASSILTALCGLAIGVILPDILFSPSPATSYVPLMPVAGLPVQLVRGFLAAALSVAFMRYAEASRGKFSYMQGRRWPVHDIFLIALLINLLVIGAVVTEWVGKAREREERRALLSLVQTGVASIDRSRVMRLSGTSSDLRNPDYVRIKEQLTRMRRATHGVRFYYLMRMSGNKVIFLADSEPEGSKEYSPPGQVFSEISEDDLAVYNSKKPGITGPTKDRWGTWISAFAPVYSDDGRMIAALGVDINALDWIGKIARTRLMVIFIILLFFSVLMLFYTLQRRTREAAYRIERVAGEQSLLLNTMHIQVWYLTDPETYGAVNDAHAAFLGRPRDEIERRPIRNFVPEDEALARIEDNRRLFRDKTRTEFDVWRTDAGGTRRLLHIVKTPKVNDSGDVDYVVCSAEDITARKLNEEALHESEVKFRTIFENNSTATAIVELDSTISMVNETFCRRSGYERHEVVGKSWTLLVPPEELERMKDYNRRRIINPLDPPSQYEFTYYTKKGDKRKALMSAVYIPSVNKTIASFADITELKSVQDALAKSLEEKGGLLRELQHRVKNSLQIITGLIELETNTALDRTATEVLQQIRDRIRSLASLYDLLYRSEEVREVQLDQYLNQMCRSIIETYTSGRGRIKLDMRLSEVKIEVKRAIPIGLIVNEILTNALKYAFPDGRSGTVHVSLDRSGDTLVLELGDDGAGMPADFNPEKSKGLGSKLILMLVEQMTGTLSLDRSAGTAYKITMPVAE
jgi:PAS domain S-box-containing protein